MISAVWFAPDVYRELTNREETMNICMASVTQYMIHESHRHGNVSVDLQRFDDAVCRITKEAIASLDPHLRNIVGVAVKRGKGRQAELGSVEVRLSRSFYSLLEMNPGASRFH